MAGFINPKEKEENAKKESRIKGDGAGANVFVAAARNDIVSLDKSIREFE